MMVWTNQPIHCEPEEALQWLNSIHLLNQGPEAVLKLLNMDQDHHTAGE
jgi:hypothetical protein